ncbi:Ser/Thr protein phosphatase 2A regulatory subunit A [Punctularia strigosozonata HHB-11173 SS5]|uniref:Ser/Thr protein phosphatase 2A regulatory subunit A n=1 Tax=Punctularia strigosozonata (strain HHB-11173) TaxID=741275 RepID=UPI0004418163|nr:Ser/Thr protein phosphatase 2A regulatory subunit A [Punctularia strigosozonata HHB-11173 SS5]EIN13734.1 Ser/Thr protein phosphatase 2A regulatory subunit A [Punctularia strigosozonata HHB-11173 SS5]
MDPGFTDDIAPIAILMDELRSEDVQLRLNAIHRISTIALALGPDRAREELIPFLQDSLDDEDEVLLALAEELGRNFEEYIGGSEYAHLLLGPLENLASVEETLVRDKATDSITNVAGVMSPSQIEQYYVPLVKRLSQGEWFTARSSAAALFHPVYDKVSPTIQDDMRKGFTALGSDDTPMVRRAAAKHLGAFAKKLSKQHVLTDGLAIYRKLQSDDQDSVRLLTVEDLIAIAQRLAPAEVKDQVLKQIRQTMTDKSWRVRYMAAQHFNELAEAVGLELVREELIGHFVQLLKDNEAEVRTAAAGQIPGFAKLLDKEVILARIVPCARDLSTDTSQHVRAALANQISGLAPLLGREATTEHLLPLFLQLLKDEFPEVRLNIISKLELVNSVIGIELLADSLLPAIVDLAEDKAWRVRQAIIEYIPLLATQLGKPFFDEQLGNLCMSWLGDTVYSIREAATVNLKKLTDVFGVEWAKVAIVPKVVGMAQHPNYLYRLTTVQAITTIAPSLNPDIILSDIIDPLSQLAADPIPNIRFNVAKCLEVVGTSYGPDGAELAQTRVKPLLEQQKNDTDADVRYFAARALQKITSA